MAFLKKCQGAARAVAGPATWRQAAGGSMAALWTTRAGAGDCGPRWTAPAPPPTAAAGGARRCHGRPRQAHGGGAAGHGKTRGRHGQGRHDEVSPRRGSPWRMDGWTSSTTELAAARLTVAVARELGKLAARDRALGGSGCVGAREGEWRRYL